MTDLTEKNVSYLRIVNIFAYIAMVLTNVLAEVLPINGITTGERSDMYPSLFTPTGFTFSIWFVIYALGLYFVIWQTWFAKAKQVDQIGLSFALSCGLNIGWILAWHYNMIWISTILIIFLMATLIEIRNRVKDENWGIKATFSIYEAWITIASMASIFIVLNKVFKGFPYGAAAQILVWVAALTTVVITFIRLRRESDVPYALAILWSLIGITIKHVSASGFAESYVHIIIGTLVCELAIVLMTMMMFMNKRKVEVINV